MLVVILALLYAVVSPSHGLEWANTEFRPDRLNKRILSRNESVTVIVTSSFDILASSLSVAGSEPYRRPADIDSITTTTATTAASIDGKSDTEELSADGTSSSGSDIWWNLFNLGTITSVGRPTLVLPSSTPVRTPPISISSSSSTSNIDSGSYPTASSFTFNTTSKPYWNTTTGNSSPLAPPLAQPPPITSSTTWTTATPSECPGGDAGLFTTTTYIITHTSTTTWTGDPSDYTPPYPPISTPVGCTPKQSPTGRFTITFCDSTGKTCSLIHTSIDPSTTDNIVNPTRTVTLVTTDKNPAVVFPTEAPPDYGGSPDPPNNHNTAGVGDGSVITPDYGRITDSTDLPKTSATSASTSTPSIGNNAGQPPPITVIVQPGEVIIDDRTFLDNPTTPGTTTVIVKGETFIIDPTRVAGAGATITRPPSLIITGDNDVLFPTATATPTPTPTTTSIGGLGVVYGGSSSVATIDGTVFTLAPTPTVAVVRGQTITLGPAGIVFASQTLHIIAAGSSAPTQTAVMGGELITALGTNRVVIGGVTLTYGQSGSGSTSTITTVIDGETILIGPAGIIVHDKTLGGPAADLTVTKYEVIGGATVTQLGGTAVEISGTTYQYYIGGGRGISAHPTLTSTVVDDGHGHTLTIGPDGRIAMSTWTLGPPFASTTTLVPNGNGRDAIGAEGSSNSNNNNNNAAMTIPTATGSKGTGAGSEENSGGRTVSMLRLGVDRDAATVVAAMMIVMLGIGGLG
ncbi:uncharacterized protein GGS25DRAFT_308969 [Hypoxylon fragiforme]|uniref:uncharacterized protein n=1 Tax=Hypoxylon fragiforme TaxID=63214 RepID=UPI0020C7442F|nr:uncharacterized protein GGS25DRAFT_308969 [Hypoxylon fragiforme]KAI2606851.1 hypothetical protein GGS25DRAFT_308969 [Hypoxylon fragiforme]